MRIRRFTFAAIATLSVFSPLKLLSDDGFFPPGHDRAGLPVDPTARAVYDSDSQHPLNQLHAILFVRELIPAEIQSQLPTERRTDQRSDRDYFQKGWYFEKRSGKESDRAVFGGDVRISPVKAFTEVERTKLLNLLKQISTRPQVDGMAALRLPMARLLVQWDILSVWWALEREKSKDIELLEAMAKSTVALSQHRSVLLALPSGLEDLHKTFSVGDVRDRSNAFLPQDFPPVANDLNSRWVELGRKSSVLFQADRTLRASKVYIQASNRETVVQALSTLSDKSKRIEDVELPDGTMTGLVQTIVAIDDQLNPVVTPVVDEVRVRVASRPFELSSDNASSSRDGSSHWIYFRTRAGSIRDDAPDFRFVSDADQSLFLEYGTLKHATFAAQCALCHRLTSDGGQVPAGIRTLSKHTQAHIAAPNERVELAEKECEKIAIRLKERLASMQLVPTDSTLEPAVPNEKPAQINESKDDLVSNTSASSRLKARAERTETERKTIASQLREAYQKQPNEWPAPNVDPGVDWKEIGLLPKVTHPSDNLHSPVKELLGKTLFFDPRLSGSRQIACASCHDPDLGWADGRTTSFGHSRKPLGRNAPSVQFSGHFDSLFWDGRATSLEDQARQVLLNPDEMRAGENDVAQELASIETYRRLFVQAFDDQGVTLDRIAKALACFQRSIDGGHTRFDAFLRGKKDALSDSELIGMDLFRRDARCINCHHGSLLSDGQFHEVGLSYYGRKFEDLGRYRVTQRPSDVGRFRTPSLRNITTTTPLMHNGLFELPGILNMYNAGMPSLRRKEDQLNDVNFPVKSRHLRALGLNKQDLADVAAFLGTLEEPKRRIRPPELPELQPAP
jgi:cytochrome c peroxidase